MMLGAIWERAPVASKEDEALSAARRQLAIQLYSRVVVLYPLSPQVTRAKERLKDMGAPIPQPDAAELARMQKERETPRDRPGVLTKVTGIVHTGPNLSAAARFGDPNLSPPDENAGDAMRRSATGMKLTGTATDGAPTADGTGTRQVTSLDGSTAIVPTPPASTTGESSSTTGTPPASTGSTTTSSTTSSSTGAPNNTGGAGSTAIPASDSTAPPPCPANAKKGATTTTGKDGKQVPCTPAGKESSSKKKSGIKKIIPWGGN